MAHRTPSPVSRAVLYHVSASATMTRDRVGSLATCVLRRIASERTSHALKQVGCLCALAAFFLFPVVTWSKDIAVAGSKEVTSPLVGQTQRFDDWEIVCPKAAAKMADIDETAQQACRLQQAQAVNGGKDVVFLFNIVLQAKKPVAIVSTPLSVYLPAGLELKIDGGKVSRAVFESCNVSGCHAGFALNEGLLASLKKGAKLIVTLQDTKANKVPVPVSLKGISAGLERLGELPSTAANDGIGKSK